MRSTATLIRLLLVFDEVYRTRNVSKAAVNLSLSQPSVSIALGRLRTHFKDPLFIKTPQGMDPTPHAQQLSSIVRRSIEMLDESLGFQTNFDASVAQREFHVAAADITQMTIVPRLLSRLLDKAPGVKLKVSRIGPELPRALEAGEVDVAVGFFSDLGPNLREKTLMTRDFVCVASVSHPRLQNAISLAQFHAERHVVIVGAGSGTKMAEEAMRRRKVKRRVVFEMPDMVGLETVIGNTDLIATVPRTVGQMFSERGLLKILPHPMRLPTYAVKQVWHERFHRDPGNQWLRQQVVELFSMQPSLETTRNSSFAQD